MSDDKRYDLSRRKVLAGLGTIGVAGAGAGLGTSALFSDTESFTNNEMVAGTLNLRTSMDVVNVGSSADPGTIAAGSTNVPFDNVRDSEPFSSGQTGLVPNNSGDPTAVVADGAAQVGLQLDDIKPGDSFVLCLQALLEGNPGYVRVISTSASDGDDSSLTEPEGDTADSPSTDIGIEDGGIGGTGDAGDDGISGNGELDNAIDVTVGTGYDSGTDEITGVDSSLSGSLNKLMNDLTDGEGINFGGSAGVPGEVPADMAQEICIRFAIPTSVGNEIQGDSVSLDLQFQAVQSRNNNAGSAFANTF